MDAFELITYLKLQVNLKLYKFSDSRMIITLIMRELLN